MVAGDGAGQAVTRENNRGSDYIGAPLRAGHVVLVPVAAEQDHVARGDSAVCGFPIGDQTGFDARATAGPASPRRDRQSTTAAGPMNCSRGTRSPVMEPAGPAFGNPDSGAGTKCDGASKWVPVCSSIATEHVWYGTPVRHRSRGPLTAFVVSNQWSMAWR